MNRLPYNITKLEAYRDSAFCQKEYKLYTNDELYDLLLQNDNLLWSYQRFCYMRWRSEYMRRNTQSADANVRLTILDKINMRKEIDALSTTHKVLVNNNNKLANVEYKPILTDLFAENIKSENWSKLELAIRLQFLLEVELAKKSGGCSSCMRNKLVRKYMMKLKDLTQE